MVLVSKLRDGTLRQCARDHGVPVLLYEGGEALRFDEMAIRAGVVGIWRVLQKLGMMTAGDVKPAASPPAFSTSSIWLRAPEGGILRVTKTIGDFVTAGETIGETSDPLGEVAYPIIAEASGIIIGRTNLPVVNRGDALYHVARVDDEHGARERVRVIGSELAQAPLFDEDEII